MSSVQRIPACCNHNRSASLTARADAMARTTRAGLDKAARADRAEDMLSTTRKGLARTGLARAARAAAGEPI
jgi:hypothetical protein